MNAALNNKESGTQDTNELEYDAGGMNVQSNEKFVFLKAMLRLIGASTVSGVFAQTMCYPCDTIRKCLQVNGANGHSYFYHSAFDCVKKLYRDSGIQAFYRGFWIHLPRSILGIFIQFTIFHAIRTQSV